MHNRFALFSDADDGPSIYLLVSTRGGDNCKVYSFDSSQKEEKLKNKNSLIQM